MTHLPDSPIRFIFNLKRSYHIQYLVNESVDGVVSRNINFIEKFYHFKLLGVHNAPLLWCIMPRCCGASCLVVVVHNAPLLWCVLPLKGCILPRIKSFLIFRKALQFSCF